MDNKLKKIFKYWDNNAKIHKTSPAASWGDINMINLEIEAVSQFIRQGDAVLDAGCANGYSTLQFLEKKPCFVKAFDYSPNMILAAKENLAACKRESCKIKTDFYKADILNIPEKDETFDVSITTRVLINLPSWHLQKKAIDQMIRVTKPGGKILFSEAFSSSLRKINKLRRLFGLSELKAPAFNNYLKESLLEAYLAKKRLKFRIIRFSSVYYIGSRLMREFYFGKSKIPSYQNPVNDFFFELERTSDVGDFGIQKLYLVEK